MSEKHNRQVYLDDMRTPTFNDWVIVRNYDEFVNDIKVNGLSDIYSLDHDLADEHYHNQEGLRIGTFNEKTGFDCALFLINYCLDNNVDLPQVYTHSYNVYGGQKIIDLINRFYVETGSDLVCKKRIVEHIVDVWY